MRFELDYQFYMRVKHNFKLYVLISSKRVNWREESILHNIYRLRGYKSHKTVKYLENSSHIHVKFEEEHQAKETVDFFNNMHSDLSAVLVDDMLRDWFTYEIKSDFGPTWTLTIVDIVGNPPLALNFLTSNILNSIFKDFGGPYLVPYTAALNEKHVQVMFGSMTEALAACMAFGEWQELGGKVDSFCYRVRINPSDKEAMLITNSGGTPSEAFKLDYFVNFRNEIFQSSRKPETDIKQHKIPRTKSSHSKGSQKVRKHKHSSASADPQSNLTNQNVLRTPILCVPVIAPLNYATVMSTSGQLGADFATAILNFQQSCSVSTRAIVATAESEMQIRSDIQYESSEERLDYVGEKNSDQPVVPQLVMEPPTDSDQLQIAVPDKSIPVLPKPVHHNAPKHKKSFHKTQSRVFERRR
jgi:hypothetical protein